MVLARPGIDIPFVLEGRANPIRVTRRIAFVGAKPVQGAPVHENSPSPQGSVFSAFNPMHSGSGWFVKGRKMEVCQGKRGWLEKEVGEWDEWTQSLGHTFWIYRPLTLANDHEDRNFAYSGGVADNWYGPTKLCWNVQSWTERGS